MEREVLARSLESTLLKPETTLEQIQQLCDEAIELDLGGVCVPPYFVKEARRRLEGKGPIVVSVVGFPLGYSGTSGKAEEIKKLVNDGADEVDVVINITAVKDANWTYLENDLSSLAQISHLKNTPIKLIIEMGMMNPDEVRQICTIAERSKIDFIKTSTGMLAPGPSKEDIAFLRSILDSDTRIKASAGIRTAEKAIALIEAGADRIGTSSAGKIMAEWKA
ncbi:MAG: deoxyribose-phosphate aldolase [Saprospiraceae bacterium]|nr:deoxyribose-phosphate aldolase [Saprospiraceae bacterium]